MYERLYYIDGRWYSYEDAHNLFGMTKSKPQILQLYTSNLTEVSIRKDLDGTLYNSVTHTWVEDLDSFTPPIYCRVSEEHLYKGCIDLYAHYTYSNSIINEIPNYIEYNSSIVTKESLKRLYGITEYICQDYIVRDGIALVWYDQEEDKYWDDRVGHKEWVDTPPEIHEDVDTQDVYIATSMSNMSFYNNFEESSLPTFYRVESFNEQDEYFNTPKELLGFVKIPYEDTYIYEKAYNDYKYYNVSLYVSSEEGITSPYTGNFYQYGYEFTGDLEEVYVESDEDVTFWKGSSTYTFGKTHDEYHTELNPLYWCVDTYKTLDELHEEGYSTTPAMDIEVLNSSNNTVSVWWKVISTGNIYCEGTWYNNESELNNAGYYIV